MGSLFHGQDFSPRFSTATFAFEQDSLPTAQQLPKGMAEFTEDEGLSKPMCGQLSKYTNVMKGWQYRWFVLSPSNSTVEYYEREEYSKNQKPRGGITLQGAVVAPSDEDSVTFTIHAANGEVYRLRADNTKMRQQWVSRLMYVAQSNSSKTSTTLDYDGKSQSSNSVWYDQQPRQKSSQRSLNSIDDNPALVEVKEYIHEMYTLEEQLVDKIDTLPAQGAHINALDQDVLLLKACSRATLGCLENCLSILERQHNALARASYENHHLPSGAKVEWISDVKTRPDSECPALLTPLEESTKILAAQSELGYTQPYPVPLINREEEVQDAEAFEEKDLGEMEQHKSVILHLLSQLKLGMDLTKVVLPTFILEKRSLLEMFADCMAHPDQFIRITNQSTAEERMLNVVEWYLTSFHEGRKGSLAKKPYNPIIGETFHCSWHVPDEQNTSQTNQLVYTAEQVSHHPPVSAFYVSCPQKQISLTGSVWTKSKFMGMSIGVTMIGGLTLSLPEHNEDYVMTLPSAYARSILTYPWVEMGDKCTIICKKSGYSASIVFHTKPFYGGKLHRISGEVKSPDGSISTKISGTWNGEIEITSPAGKRTVDTQSLHVHKKRVRPLLQQGEHESRRQWQHVTNALRHNDINTATEHKSLLEAKQRQEEKHRKEKGLSFPTRYFTRTGDISSWNYKGGSHSPSNKT